MVNFRKITEDNFDAIIKMKRPEGENFVAPNAVSLAQAWLYRDDGDVFPFAIYNDDTVVGFMLLEEEIDEKRLDLWRIMISTEHEGKGYGTAAVKLMIQYAKDSGRYKNIYLICGPENYNARHIYDKLGFQPTGKICYGDAEMKLEL
ncbi:MAG: GNAT family N-acetyltransferase [Eubacteriales bacterium]